MVVGTGKNLYKHIWNSVNVNVLQIKYESNIVTMCVKFMNVRRLSFLSLLSLNESEHICLMVRILKGGI